MKPRKPYSSRTGWLHCRSTDRSSDPCPEWIRLQA